MEGTRNLSVGSESERACLDSALQKVALAVSWNEGRLEKGESDAGLEQFKQGVRI